MNQIQLDDQLYAEARRRAAVAGFASVDEYVANVLSHDFQLDDENLAQFFTPERLALVDQASAEVAAGNFYTMDQAREELAQTKAAWLRNRAGGK